MILRTGYTIVVPFVFIALYLAFLIKGWFGTLLSSLITISLFALALAGVWASGQTESGILSGVIPMFDSTHYYLDSLRLLAGKEFSEISSRRPFFTAFFSFLLWIAAHDLLLALTILALFVTLAIYLLANEINGTHGPAITAFVLVIVFIYYRYHSGAVRTENLGVMFGALGTAMVWRGISKNHYLYLMVGFMLMSFGMIARSGAFFILPLLVVWAGISYRSKGKLLSWRYFLGGVVAIALPFLANYLIAQSFGTKDVVPFGNFSYSLFGLASGGKSWAYVFEVYPNASYTEIYERAIQLILEKPGLLIKGVVYNYSIFFSNTNYGIFSYMSGKGSAGSNISYWVLLLLLSFGIWNCFQNRNDHLFGFLAVSFVGLLLSVPFLPPTDAFRLRAYATSIVILALIPAMGLDYLLKTLRLERLTQKKNGFIYQGSLAWFSIVIVIMLLFGPFMAKGTDLVTKIDPSMCEAGFISLVVRYDPNTMVHVVHQNELILDWAPTYHVGTLHRNIHDFPNLKLAEWVLENVKPNKTLFYALDYRSFKNALVLIESKALPEPPSLIEICGNWDDNVYVSQFEIFKASSVELVKLEN